MGAIREFMIRHYRHFNAREMLEAAVSFDEHISRGGAMLVSLAGAMSTAELGVSLARMIRNGKVHAISCTGANLEEDVFNLVAGDRYEPVPNWRALTAEDEHGLYRRGMNRVTDTCIPEDVMRTVHTHLVDGWRAACDQEVTKTPADYLCELFLSGALDGDYAIDPRDSWLAAAAEARIPVFTPGWEDSTIGNMFAASVMRGAVPHHQCVMTGTEQFQRLIEWYLSEVDRLSDRPSVGFFQIGGGIAGDFAICAVPCIIQDLERDAPFWGYFAQITDADPSYGGYSGALPNEKISWGKLDVDTPRFSITSDASIVAPLIFSYVLGD